MIYDEDTMNATERMLAIINHKKPDRVSTYLMDIMTYSLCYKEFLEREEEIFDIDDPTAFGANDRNILITPLGDHTMDYYFGADVMIYGMGLDGKKGDVPFKRLLVDDSGKVNQDPNAYQEALKKF